MGVERLSCEMGKSWRSTALALPSANETALYTSKLVKKAELMLNVITIFLKNVTQKRKLLGDYYYL